jgi:NitT/TauT family transport system permease protein/taurine transport system permease protein
MIVMGLMWLFIDNVYLKPFERATVERWGQVTTAEARE